MTGRRIPGPTLRSIAHAVGAVVMIAAVVLVAITAVPTLVGAEKSYVVQSDSMAPAIESGAVVFVAGASPESLRVGDVITYEHAGDGPVVTHRIVDVVQRADGRYFRTKGDANDAPDGTLVAADAVVGRVTFHLPLVGYLLDFAGSSTGMLVLVVVPGVLLAVSEGWRLYRDATARPAATDADPGGEAEP